jgi:hypothetical protein
MFGGLYKFPSIMMSSKVPQTFKSSLKWFGKYIFELFMTIYDFQRLINGFIIVKYDHGKSIYKILTYYYNEGHAP